uniref:C2H2-type domain-containing protein n=2 Tax=Takifugu rubripes TaxID=31033 RepID=A0A3B5K9N6_TAKRU
MHSLRVFLNERLAAAAEEILGAVEKTIIEYREEICRSKDLEISRLRMQLKLLKSGWFYFYTIANQTMTEYIVIWFSSTSRLDKSPPTRSLEESSGVEQKHPQPSLVKEELDLQQSQEEFWMDPEEHDHLDHLESDIKDFMSSPPGLRSGLQDAALSFHPYSSDNSNGDESRERPYCCSVCEKRFSNSSHLAAHIRTHTGERPYRCDICRKSFITTSALNRHQTIHSEGKRFICNYCGKTFKWMESLGRHIRSVHKRENQPERGEVGGQQGGVRETGHASTPDQTQRWRHVLRLHQKTELTCHITVEFWMDPEEHDHLDHLESDIKDFMSSPPGLRSGLQDAALSFHPYSSDNSNGDESRERPYCCSVCEKRFSNSSHLAAHIRTHTGERPYRCDICRKSFITTSALNRHQTIHSEGKRFICNYCGKTFKWMESLGRHIRSVHKRENQMYSIFCVWWVNKCARLLLKSYPFLKIILIKM